MRQVSSAPGATAPAARAEKHPATQRRTQALRTRRAEYAVGTVATGLVLVGLVAAWFNYAELARARAISPPSDAAPGSAARRQIGVVRVPDKGTTCREFAVNNQTGALGADKLVPCGPNSVGGTSTVNASFDSYRKAFGKKASP